MRCEARGRERVRAGACACLRPRADVCINTCMATKRGVNLRLTDDHYEAARELLSKLPGKPSVSSVVDVMLRDFVVRMGPLLQMVATSSPLDRVQAVKHVQAEVMSMVSLEFADTVRTLQQEGEKAE